MVDRQIRFKRFQNIYNGSELSWFVLHVHKLLRSAQTRSRPSSLIYALCINWQRCSPIISILLRDKGLLMQIGKNETSDWVHFLFNRSYLRDLKRIGINEMFQVNTYLQNCCETNVINRIVQSSIATSKRRSGGGNAHRYLQVSLFTWLDIMTCFFLFFFFAVFQRPKIHFSP